MIKTIKEDEVVSERIPCIYYPLRFRKDTINVKALIDFGNKANAMTLAYASKLGLQARHINVEA